MLDSFFDFLVSLFNPKPKAKGGNVGTFKDVGGAIIPNGLKPVTTAKFKDFDKKLFYKKLKLVFPKNANTIYRILALETAHFKSGQFIYTGSAGMVVHKSAYPYGWTSALELWKNKDFAPTGYKIFNVGNNKTLSYLAFKTPMSFAAYLNKYLLKYPAGRWNSTKPEQMAKYELALTKIKLPNIA
jgi:hypothetical protein